MLGKKIVFGVFGVGIGIVAACGGADPVAKCNEINATTCDKLYGCFTGASLDAVKMLYGPTAADCKTKLNMNCNQAGSGSTGSGCPSGQSFDSAKADQCIADYKAASCDSLMSGGPASCKGPYCK